MVRVNLRFFFSSRRRHTRFDCDWSSDVCSSDVGVGNSGAEIASEIARAGGKVTVAVRSGANVVPLTLAGLPIQYVAHWVRKLPRRGRQGGGAFVGRPPAARRRGAAAPPPPRTG